MERAISAFCQSLAAFCNHVETTSKSLSDSIQRRPIPLDSAASAFLQSIDRRISSASADLDLLEQMAFGTVSFEELLGHCNEVFKNNQRCITDLEDRMQIFGYVPEVELEDDADEDIRGDAEFVSPVSGVHKLPLEFGFVSVTRSIRKVLEDDSLFEDSISLQNPGLSDACLDILAEEGGRASSSGVMSLYDGKTSGFPEHTPSALASKNAAKATIKVAKVDYDRLPPFMKSLVSWEELHDAVDKINTFLSETNRENQNDAFHQEELEKMGLGRKGKSYLLLLLRMNQIVAETTDNSIYYRVDAAASL